MSDTRKPLSDGSPFIPQPQGWHESEEQQRERKERDIARGAGRYWQLREWFSMHAALDKDWARRPLMNNDVEVTRLQAELNATLRNEKYKEEEIARLRDQIRALDLKVYELTDKVKRLEADAAFIHMVNVELRHAESQIKRMQMENPNEHP